MYTDKHTYYTYINIHIRKTYIYIYTHTNIHIYKYIHIYIQTIYIQNIQNMAKQNIHGNIDAYTRIKPLRPDPTNTPNQILGYVDNMGSGL